MGLSIKSSRSDYARPRFGGIAERVCMSRLLQRGFPGETTIRVVLAVAVIAALVSVASLTRGTSAAPVSLTKNVVTSADDARTSESGAYSGNERVALVGA